MPAMTATAADYLWFEERFPDLAEAYCITLVHDLSPADLLDRLGGRQDPALTGVTAIVDAAFDVTDRYDFHWHLVAMTRIGPWTLMIEPNGWLGVTEEQALPASSGTTWVSHFTNIKGLDSFLWAEETTNRLAFEPMFPDDRYGSTPDDVLDVMHRIGFHFGTDAPETDISVPASFALAEELTGVRLTPELLESTTYICGIVRNP
jgi:hypothetical protein